MFPKMVVPPNHPFLIGFSMVFHYKPSILGYHYFWKHPYTVNNQGFFSAQVVSRSTFRDYHLGNLSLRAIQEIAKPQPSFWKILKGSSYGRFFILCYYRILRGVVVIPLIFPNVFLRFPNPP